ncbi:MAG: hypothetical protein UW09_C0003G0167 [candidate division TM6 bacterium GW2011_GWF2_43_87]|nr:MAG: hypothetical protein UW09_C0003G0167 [candidate division TM6 bacterium GW2011_GWF2_43_87]
MFACSLHPLPLSSLRGFEFVEKDAFNPLSGGYCGKTAVENVYNYGKSGHVLTKVVMQMFHQVAEEDPILSTKQGFFGQASLYDLGYFATLLSKKEVGDDLKKLAKSSKQSGNKIAEQLKLLADMGNQADVYSKDMPFFLLNALAVERAETKKEYLEFLKGFYDHCSEEQKKWFTADPNKIATEEWQELRYTSKEYALLCNSAFPSPSKMDLLYACAKQQCESIHWMYVKFTLPSENNKKKSKEISVGDCCESGVWAAMQIILSPYGNDFYDLSVLPTELQSKPLIKEFVERFMDCSINDPLLRGEQFFVLSDPQFKQGRGKLVYCNPNQYYEVKASINNILNALNYMFGIDAKDFKELGALLSSFGKQKVTFDVSKSALKNDVGDIEIIVEDLQSKKTRRRDIGVKVGHVEVGALEQSSSEELLETPHDELKKKQSDELCAETFLEKANIDTTQFPFSACVYSKVPRFNLFRLLSGNELNNVYRMWAAQDEKSQLVQKQVLQLIDFKKIEYQGGDLDANVLKILAQCANQSPFKEFIQTSNSTELVRMLIAADVVFPFFKNVRSGWKNLREAMISVAVTLLMSKGAHEAALFLNEFFLKKYKVDWKENPVFLRNLFLKLREEMEKAPKNMIKDPKLEFFGPLVKKNFGGNWSDVTLKEIFATIWCVTKNPDLVVVFLNSWDSSWKARWFFFGTCLKREEVGETFFAELVKNPEHELFKAFLDGFSCNLAEFAYGLWGLTESPELLVQFLDKYDTGWQSKKEEVAKVCRGLVDHASFIKQLMENPSQPFFKLCITSCLVQIAVGICTLTKSLSAVVTFLNEQKSGWQLDKKFIQELWWSLSHDIDFVRQLPKNLDHELLKFFIQILGLADVFYIVWVVSTEEDYSSDVAFQFLNKQKPGWQLDQFFVNKLYERFKNTVMFKCIEEDPTLPYYKPFVEQMLCEQLPEGNVLQKGAEKWLGAFLPKQSAAWLLGSLNKDLALFVVLDFLKKQKRAVAPLINVMSDCPFKKCVQLLERAQSQDMILETTKNMTNT